MKKWIQIWYSWGDQESPVEIPEGIDAWKYMEQVVATEMFVSQEDYPYGCTMYAYVDKGKVELKYHQDDEWCHYLITEVEDFNPWGTEKKI